MYANKKNFFRVIISLILLGGSYGITLPAFSAMDLAIKKDTPSAVQGAKFYIVNPSQYPLQVQCGTYGEEIIQGTNKYVVELFPEQLKGSVGEHYYFADSLMGRNVQQVNCIIKLVN